MLAVLNLHDHHRTHEINVGCITEAGRPDEQWLVVEFLELCLQCIRIDAAGTLGGDLDRLDYRVARQRMRGRRMIAVQFLELRDEVVDGARSSPKMEPMAA